MPVHGPAHAGQRAHVGHQRADLLGKPERGDRPTGYLVHQDVLVPGRVEVVQARDLHPGPRCGAIQGFGGFRVLGLDGDHRPVRAHHCLERVERPDDAFGFGAHDVLVGVQERFALAAVGDDRLDAGCELDVRGETRAALADDASQADRLEQC